MKALSELLARYRTDRPDEWTMDEFKRAAEALEIENARLRAEIDAANAQEHVASIGGVWELRWAGAGPIAPIVEKHGLQIGDKLYARPIPAQQSPAVAVPDCVECSLTWLDSALRCESFHWDGDQHDAAKYELEQAINWLKVTAAITPHHRAGCAANVWRFTAGRSPLFAGWSRGVVRLPEVQGCWPPYERRGYVY